MGVQVVTSDVGVGVKATLVFSFNGGGGAESGEKTRTSEEIRFQFKSTSRKETNIVVEEKTLKSCLFNRY